MGRVVRSPEEIHVLRQEYVTQKGIEYAQIACPAAH